MALNRRDLIDAVFHNEKTDRVPVGFWHHFLADETGSDAFSHPELTEKVLAGRRISIKPSGRTSSKS